MLDRILASANPDGLLYNEVDADTLEPLDERLSDNWGYVYGAVYTYYQVTGETQLSRRRAARAREPAEVPATTSGSRATTPACRSGRSTATPTPSRARSIS